MIMNSVRGSDTASYVVHVNANSLICSAGLTSTHMLQQPAAAFALEMHANEGGLGHDDVISQLSGYKRVKGRSHTVENE